MTRRLTPPALFGALAVLAVIVAAVVVLPGGSSYRVHVQLASANGLRTGSEVRVGGVPVGTISDIGIGSRDDVEATLDLDPAKVGRIHRDASVKIVTANLLGQKYLVVDPGRKGPGEPSGAARVASRRVSYPTDLDQVLSMLDPDTRARFQIMVNELAGAATGRKAEIGRTLQLLPTDLVSARKLLAQLVNDNTTLAGLVETSDDYVTALADHRRTLTDAIDGLGRTVAITGEHHRALAGTLAAAPGTLRTANRFLADLQAATRPLGPAARAIARTAPALDDTLARLPAFQRAADPALKRAVIVSPQLTQLATTATPIVTAARPTLSALRGMATAAGPAGRVLDVSIDDLMGVIEGWASAIQGRDGAAHIFHGKFTGTPELLRTLVGSLDLITAARRHHRAHKPSAPALPDKPALPRPQVPSLPKLPQLPPVPHIPLPKLPVQPPQVPAPVQQAPDDAQSALDYLLGP